jgi:anti-anti-sigma factor
VLLDCEGVTFCDSYGLSVLLMVRRQVQLAGGRLTLENRRHSLDRLLELTDTYRYLTGGHAASGGSREELDT